MKKPAWQTTLADADQFARREKANSLFSNCSGRTFAATRTNETLYLVLSDLGGGRTTADAFDAKGRWLQRWLLDEAIEGAALPMVPGDELHGAALDLERTTLELRSLWRDDDYVTSSERPFHVDLGELINTAFSHESFIESNGLFGERADFSTKRGYPGAKHILPPESWARSAEVGLDFRGVDFSGAILTRCDLRNCLVQGGNFSRCDLRRANLFGLDLTECNFQGADLTYADLRETKGLILDDARVLHARFSPANLWISRRLNWLASKGESIARAAFRIPLRPSYRDSWIPRQDPWSALRRHYTGPMLLFHIALLAVYLAPLALRAIVWREVNLVQSAVEVAQRNLNVSQLSPCLLAECDDPLPVGLAILGFHTGGYSFLFSALLMIYNFVRGFLTYRVSLLRDEEERSNHSPSRKSYLGLFRLHQLATCIWAPVVAHLLVEAFRFLALSTVQIPKLR